MENPATWGRAERVVHEVRMRWEVARASDEFYAGLSLERQITDALRQEGLLIEESDAGH